MNVSFRLSVMFSAVALVSAGAPVAEASAKKKPPQVGKQVNLKTRTSPVSIPALHIKLGERLPSRYRVVMRVITMEGGQSAVTRLGAPRGYRMRLLVDGGNQKAWLSEALGAYRGSGAVRFRAYVQWEDFPRTPGRVYAIVERHTKK